MNITDQIDKMFDLETENSIYGKVSVFIVAGLIFLGVVLKLKKILEDYCPKKDDERVKFTLNINNEGGFRERVSSSSGKGCDSRRSFCRVDSSSRDEVREFGRVLALLKDVAEDRDAGLDMPDFSLKAESHNQKLNMKLDVKKSNTEPFVMLRETSVEGILPLDERVTTL